MPLFVSVSVFATYAGTGEDMSPAVVFTSLTVISIIRSPFSVLSGYFSTIAHVSVSLRRIGEFLNKPEIDSTRIALLPHAGVQVDAAQFDWGHTTAETKIDGTEEEVTADDSQLVMGQQARGAVGLSSVSQTATKAEAVAGEKAGVAVSTGRGSNEMEFINTTDSQPAIGQDKIVNVKTSTTPPILTNVTFTASSAELVLVIGQVGSGKSSLLCGLLGEVEMTAGRVAVGGKLGYVPQCAFITNASLRENILFGQPYDSVRYQQCVEACALDADMAMLPNGDLTEIGERGINISGGQKQRVSIACRIRCRLLASTPGRPSVCCRYPRQRPHFPPLHQRPRHERSHTYPRHPLHGLRRLRG